MEDEFGAIETAVEYADAFVDAAVAKLDRTFGKGFAAANPAAFAAYMAACAANLNSFMLAATTGTAGMAEALAAMEDEYAAELPLPAPGRSGKKGRGR